MAIHYLYPISHVKIITPSEIVKESPLPRGTKLVAFVHFADRKLSVRGVRPSRWAIRHERGGFNG